MNDYTIGSWAVSDQIADTVTTAKTISIPDLKYTDDYIVAKEGTGEVILHNITGSDLGIHESIKYGRKRIDNIYQSTEVDCANKPVDKSGIRLTGGLELVLKAENSVSGRVDDLACKAWVTVQFPNHPAITPAALKEIRNRLIAATCEFGSSDESRLLGIAKGQILPNGM